jgi:hypothetical protein
MDGMSLSFPYLIPVDRLERKPALLTTGQVRNPLEMGRFPHRCLLRPTRCLGRRCPTPAALPPQEGKANRNATASCMGSTSNARRDGWVWRWRHRRSRSCSERSPRSGMVEKGPTLTEAENARTPKNRER